MNAPKYPRERERRYFYMQSSTTDCSFYFLENFVFFFLNYLKL